MKTLKKLIFLIFIMWWLWGTFSLAQNFYYDYQPLWNEEDNTNIGKIFKDDSITPQNATNYRLREAFKITGWIYAKGDKKAIDYIKMIVNLWLSLVAFISLILIIFAFYLMFFKEQEEWRTQAKKIIKWVLIAIVAMWVSFFIVSFIFYLYQITTGTNPDNNTYNIIQGSTLT